MTFEESALRVMRALRPGEVVSYGDVARAAGYPGAHRAVGALLARGPVGIPWWRVVRADGHLSAPDVRDQARRLRAEGVTVVDGRVRRGSADAAPR